jgi:hypothetical protein
MNANLTDLISIIPDFSEFVKLTEEIGELSFRKMSLEKDIRSVESNIVKEATINEKWFISGKPLSMSFIDSTYKYTGFYNELIPLREKLAEIASTLEKRKLLLSVYRDMLEVFRTISANSRASGFE